MAIKRMSERGKMHKIRREAQRDGSLSDIFPTSKITGVDPNVAPPSATVITADDGHSAFTTVVSTVEIAVTQPITTFTTTQLHTVRITDAAQYSSLQASQSRETAHATTSENAPSATTSSSASTSKSSSANLSTLIPAIVVPVAAVLIISFALFWFMMRRRHKRQLKEEPQFVMASKPEKPLSRGNSNSSGHSSTRELVCMSKLEKEVVVTTTPDVKRSSMDLFPPKYASADIGVARLMTPPETHGDKSEKKAFTNFSSVRPKSSGKGALGMERSTGNRSRSHSTTVQRDIPGSLPPGRIASPKTSRGPSPTMGGQMTPHARSQRPVDSNLRSGPRSPPRNGLPALNTTMNNGNRAAPPKPLNPDTPTGAFNGASPISQYSPIVKGMPDMGAIAAANVAGRRGQPSSIKTAGLPGEARMDSPVDENVLSNENMRIARLANSSRLGFNHSPVDPEPTFSGSNTHRLLSPLKENDSRREVPVISPRLPPPLTREDLPQRPFARGPDSPAGGSSIYPSPSIGSGATPQLPQIGGGLSAISLAQSDRNKVGMASAIDLHHRVSVVSKISTDDGYVDMELDNKSDVSSLDEREKWEFEEDRRETASRQGIGYAGSGYGSATMSPVGEPMAMSSAAGTGKSKQNMRDRDSEGPFVLSRY